ncbi:MAG: hypothetical protein WAW23_11690 [Candidatus Methanoperedens sp.]
MGKNGDKAGDKIIDLFRVFVIGIIVIYAGFTIVESLIKTVPLWIQVIFGGLLVAFVYAIREQVIEFIKNIGK